jgi:hypothetical protein
MSSTLRVSPSSSRTSSTSSLPRVNVDPAHLSPRSNPPQPAPAPGPTRRPIPVRRQTTKVFLSFPNTPNASNSNLPSYLSTDPANTAAATGKAPAHRSLYHDAAYTEEPASLSPPPPDSSRVSAALARTLYALKGLNEFMTPPLWAALASLVVACVPRIQHVLEVHAQPVKGALSAAGSCSIPITLIVLGAYFYQPPIAREEGAPPPPPHRPSGGEDEQLETGVSAWSLKTLARMFNTRKVKRRGRLDIPAEHGENGTGNGNGNGVGVDGHNEGNGRLVKTSDDTGTGTGLEYRRPGETKTVIIAIASRMIITPVVLLPLMALSKRWDLQAVLDECVSIHAS